MARRTEIIGMRELERSFRRLGKVPQTVATKSAKAGAKIAHKAAKQNAPEDTGNLKGAIVLKAERRVKVGKKVYDIMIDPAKNDLFVKMSADGNRSYYPASQEYGWMTETGHYIPGYRFLKRAITDNERAIERKILDVAGTEVVKALNAR
ncbi:HK97 gp10 family phage protein [Paenibacillus sp. S150]|uniref:HK97 gp10 family phage protein n=1 Tax=Paenibacillus sp. S150 TaxID=2749826 RepID=UPI001C5968AD|nr:HK97 gp10 family phage protein [Paenibacillus sp. S150]MBW4083528.1 HK97 gp10 family phage protein [Paenibacillus sp. S150]